LEKAQEKLRFTDKILQRVGTLVLVTNINSEVIYCSKFVKSILGYEPEEVLGLKWWDVTLDSKEERHKEIEYLRACLNGELPFPDAPYKKKIKTKSGDYKWILWQDALGEGKTIIGVGTDINDQVIASLELQRAKDEIAKALEKEIELNDLKSRFISMISHEYRTPLTVILNSTSIIEHYANKENLKEVDKFVNKIKISIKNLTNLLEEVLLINKADMNKLQVELSTFQLEAFCREIIDDVALTSLKTNPVSFTISPGLESIKSDKKLFGQIVTNLLTNAVKYSFDDNAIQLELCENDSEVEVKVTNEGIGIPEEDYANLFQEFHRGRNVGSISGIGLGMSIIMKCVKLLKENIKVESEVNRRTTITVSLPKNNNLQLNRIY